MELLLELTVEPLEEGGYLATSDELPGLLAQGRTIAETIESAQDVARKLIEAHLEHGDPLPPRLRGSLLDIALSTPMKVPIGLSLDALPI